MDKCVIVSLLVIAVSVIVSSRENELCPPWFFRDSNTTCHTGEKYCSCFCSSITPSKIYCDLQHHRSYIILGNCAFWDNNTGHTLVLTCPYISPSLPPLQNYSLQLPQNVETLNSYLCNHYIREEGNIFCGRCKNGTGPAVNSVGSQCVPCHLLHVLYFVFLHILPATFLFFFILIFQIDVLSNFMAFYILYCNMVTVFFQSPAGISPYLTFQCKYLRDVVLTFHSLWSFDVLYFLSPPLCFSSQLDDIDIVYIQILNTLYPFFLIIIAYVGIECNAHNFRPVVILWKPIHKFIVCLNKSWNPHLLLVQAFATTFFMSYTKLLFLIAITLMETDSISETGQVMKRTLYIDLQSQFGRPKHVLLTIFTLGIFAVFILPPLIVLLTYPTRLFIKLQNYLSPRANLAIKIFVSAFQGNYKDGYNGTRDYRIFPALILIWCGFCLYFTYIYNLFTETERTVIIWWQYHIILLTLFSLLLAVVRPHKSEMANNTAVSLTVLLIIGCTLFILYDVHPTTRSSIGFIVLALLTLPHIVLYSYLLYSFVCRKVWRKCYCNAAVNLEQNPLIT